MSLPAHSTHSTAYQKEVPPQEGQAMASLPGDEAEMGEQVLPISSGDKTILMFKLQISLSCWEVLNESSKNKFFAWSDELQPAWGRGPLEVEH